MPSSPYLSKFHVALDGKGYILSQKNGIRLYQKKKAPTFVNKFGGGDSSYRDATFWQYFVQTNWRNGAKQLKFDDAGKFWKSQNVDTTILEELSLSKAFVSAGQLAAGIKVNVLETWRSSSNWWNASYGYRQQITVTNPNATAIPANYPVKVTIDTAALETASKLRSDRKDWRIVYFNGSGWVDLSRDYISTTTTFFPTQAAIAGGSSDSNYYAFYGYASESTDKQPSAEADWNSVYGFFGTTPDTNSKVVYHMREGSGTSLNDDSANSNTGTINGASWATDGKFGRHLTFNASSQYVDLGTGSDFQLGSMTLEGWFYLNDTSRQNLISKSNSDNAQKAFQMYVDSGKLHGRVSNGADAPIMDSNTTVVTGQWYHFAFTYDGSVNGKLYINGTLDKTTALNMGVNIAASTPTNLGRSGDSGDQGYLDGKMQHVRISNIERTSFPYALVSEPTFVAGSETTTQPPSTSFDVYGGGSDGKIYKWDGTTTWTEQFDTRRLAWYETGTDANKVVGDTGSTETAQAQSFQIAAGQTIQGLEVYLKKSAGTPGSITVRIETNSTDKPSGVLADANATATIPAFTTTSYAWISVEFSTTFTLSATTAYWIVLETAAAADDNNYSWAADASSPTYSSGTMASSTDGGTTWSAVTGSDAYFRVKGQTNSINCSIVTSVGGTQKMYLGTGNPTGQTNGDARLYSFDGTNWVLTKTFTTATESMVNSITEFTADSKVYVGVGPQARVYSTSDLATFTLSKDINIPQNPGYVYAQKEYNRVLHVGGGSPEFLPTQYYNGFLNVYDTTAWNILYPFDFTVIKSLEFYDAYLFMGTYRGDLYVYDTATLNPLFNFKDQYNFKVQIAAMKYFDDKLYIALYPQDNSNETNVGIWLFDRRGLSLAHTVDGVTGFKCFATVNGALMIGTGDNGYVYKLDPAVYAATGYVQSSYFDANLPSIPKLYNAITIRHDALLEGQTINVSYRFKESDTWVQLTTGATNTAGDIEQTLLFNSGITSKKISLKVELNTTVTTASPKLTEVVMQYALYPVRRWQWTLRLKAKKNLHLLDGSIEPRTADVVRSNIESLLNTEQLYNYVDIDGTSYNVLVNDVDNTSWVINQSDVNEDEVAVTLLQA